MARQDFEAQQLATANTGLFATLYGSAIQRQALFENEPRWVVGSTGTSFDLTVEMSPVNFKKFRALVDQWRRETRHTSRLSQIVMHPSYQHIMTWGMNALPFIFEDLALTSDHWLWALSRILPDEHPAKADDDYETAVQAWLKWGREHGYL